MLEMPGDKRAKCRQVDDAFNQFVDMMIEADGVILACPSYFAGVTPELKALIDRTGMVNIAGGFPMARKVPRPSSAAAGPGW